MSALPVLNAGWDARLAADYLDTRQKDWFAWKGAQRTSGPCISCHTGITYLMARPALRRRLGETEPTPYETGLLDAMRKGLAYTKGSELSAGYSSEPRASQAIGVESVLAALFLAGTPDERRAFGRVWQLQQEKDWHWFSLNLDPWEMPESQFFGGSLTLMALGSASPEYRASAEAKAHQKSVSAWLAQEESKQPLHNKLMLLAGSAKTPDAIDGALRRSIASEAWRAQQPDGSWTMAGLGPWNEHAAAPKHDGSDAYATAVAAFALKRSGVPATDARMKRALEWLEAHQDPKGYWDAASLNKVYAPDSMMAGFMRDAATGYAVLALSD